MKPTSLVLRLAVLAAIAGAAVSIAGAAGGATACCGNNRLLYFSGDAIRNYDYLSQSPVSTNVDWGVSLLFYNNANINKIKNALNPYGYSYTGGTMYGRLSDDGAATYVWDTDGGRKRGDCYTAYTHYRIYAHPSYDYMYNPAMGYFLFGSTHHDYQECGAAYFGFSEGAEGEVASDAYSAFGVSSQHDWANFYNYEPYRQEGDHYWDLDGRASYVRVP